MDYKALVLKSFKLAWRYKWLWVFGLFAGGGGFSGGGNGGSFNFNNGSSHWNGNDSSVRIDAFMRHVRDWAGAHIALIVGVILAAMFLFLVMIVFSIIARGALIGAAASLDQDEETSFGQSFKMGLHNFWSVFGFGLLLFLIIFAPVMLLIFIGVMAALTVPLLLIFFVPLLLVFIPLAIAVSFISSLGLRFIVIDGRGAAAALGEGWRLMWRRLGPVVLTWLISVGLAIGFGMAVVIVLLALLVPTGIAGYVAFRAGFSLLKLAVFVFIGLAIIAALLVVQGAFGAYHSVYWTLAFRQMRALDADGD